MKGFTCRSCGEQGAAEVLDLGIQPLANNLLGAEDLLRPEPRFPLVLMKCRRCHLLQIRDIVPPVELFSEYLYFSSFSDSMLRHAAAAVEKHCREGNLNGDSRVVEIASNDGYLLKNFVQAGIPCLGIEPAENIAKVARENGVPTKAMFFGSKTAGDLVREGMDADLVLGNNVFAHAPDTNDFVAGLRVLLKPGGRIALEFPYAMDFLRHTEFDTIYHEHVFYFSLTALMPLFTRHRLEVFDVELLAIHGGSLRLYAGHPGVRPVKPTVGQMLSMEQKEGVAGAELYESFANRAWGLRNSLRTLLGRLAADGKRVAAYGASAKGSTLLNFFGLGRQDLDCLEFVCDRSVYKQGKLTPGSHLPILPAEQLSIKKPDYALLLTWNFADEILAQQKKYRAEGGKFIIPIPEVRVV